MSDKTEKSLPTSVLIGWILTTLFTPFAVFYYILTGGMASIGGNMIYSILWAYIPPGANWELAGTSIFGLFLPVDPSSVFYGLHILNPLILMWIPMYGFFNILFAVLVIRHIQNKTSMKKTIIAGLLTLAIPLYQTFLFLPYLLTIGPYYIGPIPIQLIVGILIARKYSPKPVDAPWSD